MASRRGKAEVPVVTGTEESICAIQYVAEEVAMSNHTSIVPNANTRTLLGGAVSEDAKTHSFELRNWYAFGYRCGEDRE